MCLNPQPAVQGVDKCRANQFGRVLRHCRSCFTARPVSWPCVLCHDHQSWLSLNILSAYHAYVPFTPNPINFCPFHNRLKFLWSTIPQFQHCASSNLKLNYAFFVILLLCNLNIDTDQETKGPEQPCPEKNLIFLDWTLR